MSTLREVIEAVKEENLINLIPINVSKVTGRRFSRLTILTKERRDSNGKPMFLCRCDCGAKKYIRWPDIKNGKTKSCGCLVSETSQKTMRKLLTTHGESKTELFARWIGMKGRCYCKSASNYHNYGARGITIDEEWKNDFLSFKKWSLENGYSKGLSIDRIDNSLGYNPSNCRWIPLPEQAKNKRNTVSFRGETATDAGLRLGGSSTVVHARVSAGWPLEEAFNLPLWKVLKR